jgi:3-phenylpropionate/trans-cinnamate dioxygenase ferredoxin reductase component
MEKNIVIVGGGQAGFTTAANLRNKKHKGSILIFGEEVYPPYQRPPLSKSFLTDESQEQSLYIKSQSYYDKNNISIICNKKATKINRESKSIIIDNKDKYHYEKLVIATGSKLNKLDLSCNESNIHYLRSITDSIAIKSTLSTKDSIVIIGAGYIGLEIAAAAIKKNLSVTVIEMEKRSMSRSLCIETSQFLQNKHETEGVTFIFNTSVIDIIDFNLKKRVSCSNGMNIDADAIVIGVGVKPNTKLAEDAKLECMNGIIVDKNGQTSDANIFAAGDCTNHPNEVYNRRLRLESVHNAVEQAKTVAASICGEQKPYSQVPWFWSDQYNIKLQIAGISDGYDEYVIRGNPYKEKFSTFYLKDKILIAVVAINDQYSYLKGKKLISLRARISKDILENMKIDLKELI